MADSRYAPRGNLPDNRCESRSLVYRCVREYAHEGIHYAPLEGNRAWRWGMSGWGCCDPKCICEPNHELPHRDGRGTSWWPIEDGDE